MVAAMARPTGGDSIDQVRGSVWLLAAAMALVAVAILLFVRPLLFGATPPAAPDESRAGRRAAGRWRSCRRIVAQPAAPPGSARVRARPVPRAVRAAATRRGGARCGAARTRRDAATTTTARSRAASRCSRRPAPIRRSRGIIVPDDFELPPGYVRHYQATDDGEQLPPILMFHPDFDSVDEHGAAVALPADRVVPPEMAPPGMPIQMLEVPRRRRPRPRHGALSRSRAYAPASLAGVAAVDGDQRGRVRALRARRRGRGSCSAGVGLVPWLAALDRARTLRAARCGAGC